MANAINKNQIKIGVIPEQKLVNLFGSDAQKQSYEKEGHFVHSNKQKLLDKVSKYCNIKDLGNRTYEIKSVYPYTIPSSFNKMNKSLYQYIVPLLLNYLINGHDKNRKVNITLGKWAREINMVNHNYNLVKYNKEETSNEIQYNLETINDFYDKADDAIDRYITNALDHMKKAGLIIWRESYYMNIEVSSGESVIDENGNVFVDVNIEQREALKEDMDYYSKCIGIADKSANIENSSERYYSKKSKRFNEVLKKELYKKKIKCIYKTYEAYYVNLDKCKFVMNLFGKFNKEKIIKAFNDEFTNLLMENAGKRFDKAPAKYTIYDDKEDYQLCFQGLCEMTISKDTEYLGYRIKHKKLEDDYNLHITSEKNKKG